MIKWAEIIERNKEQLITELENAFKEAVDCRYMQHVVEIYQNGKIRTWACAAGSHSFSFDSWTGESLVVGTFCFQNLDIEVTEEDFRRHMTEEEQKDVAWKAEEDGLSFLNYIYGSGNYRELIDTVEQEWREWYKDEYAYSEAERILYEALEREEHYLEACGGQYERRTERVN